MSKQYGVRGIPYAFVIDQNGNIAGHGQGVETVLGIANSLIEKQSNPNLKR